MRCTGLWSARAIATCACALVHVLGELSWLRSEWSRRVRYALAWWSELGLENRWQIGLPPFCLD